MQSIQSEVQQVQKDLASSRNDLAQTRQELQTLHQQADTASAGAAKEADAARHQVHSSITCMVSVAL